MLNHTCAIAWPPKVQSSPKTITFVDANAMQNPYYGLDINHNTEIVVIESDCDGIELITATLADLSNVSSLQIIGSLNSNEANLQLGLTQLNIHTIDAYRHDLQSWQDALSAQSAIWIYGCFVMVESLFENLIHQLAAVTKSDIGAFVRFDPEPISTNDLENLSLMVAWQS